MQITNCPGRIRVRDPIFRVEEIRSAAIDIAKIICPNAQITYTEKTSGILAIYPPESLNLEKLKTLLPLLKRVEPQIRFYTPKKKQAVLDALAQIKQKASELKAGIQP